MQNNETVSPTLPAGQLRVVFSNETVAAASAWSASVGPLLEICLAQTNSQGAYVYRLDSVSDTLDLIAWRGTRPTSIPSYSVQVSLKATRWYRDFSVHTVLEEGAWLDWRFQDLPEFLQNRFESTVSIPILDGGRLSGIANFCQVPAHQYNPREIAFLRDLSLPFGSLMAKSRLESEVVELNRKLEDRKLLDRAKGILRARFGWTEEEAYGHLRRTSRQSRAPMRSIAQHVIQKSMLPSTWQEVRFRD